MILNHEQPITISLSQEEIAYLVKLQGVDTIPGLGIDPFRELSSEQQGLARGMVQRSLVARGILQADSNGLTMHDFLSNIVTICVRPMCVLSIALVERGHSTVQVYSIGPKVAIEHTVRQVGIHTLIVHTPIPDFRSQIADMLHETAKNGPSLSVFSLTRDQLEYALKGMTPVDETGVSGLDEETEVTETSWVLFVGDARDRRKLITIQVATQLSDPPRADTLMWLQGAQHLWQVSQEDPESPPSNFNVQLVTRFDAEVSLTKLLALLDNIPSA